MSTSKNVDFIKSKNNYRQQRAAARQPDLHTYSKQATGRSKMDKTNLGRNCGYTSHKPNELCPAKGQTCRQCKT